MGLLDRLRTLLSGTRIDQGDHPINPDNNTNVGIQERAYNELGAEIDATYSGYLNETRASRARFDLYAQYREMEEFFPELHSGLDMYADYTISGGGIDATDNYEIMCEDKQLLDAINQVEERVRLKKYAWSIVRSLCRDGDLFAENVCDVNGLGRVKVLPVRTIYRREDKFGNLLEEGAFIQKIGQKVIPFEPWQVTHWRMMVDAQEMYGRSIMYPIRRLCKELSLAEDALSIARLTRAHQRWKWVVDVTGMNQSQALNYINQFKRDNRRRRIIDPQTGRLMTQNNPLRAEEDIYVPKTKEGVGDVIPVNGDASINSIVDVLHKYDRMFTCMKLSKAWFGLTGPNIRSVMGEQGLNFMRTVRRIRYDYTEGAVKSYFVGAKLLGVPDEKLVEANVTLRYPMMSHADDELRYKLDELRLNVAKMYMSQRLMDRKMILTMIFKKTDDEADAMIAAADADQVGAASAGGPIIAGPGAQGDPLGASAPAYQSLEARKLMDDMKRAIDEHEEIRAVVDDIREIVQHIEESKPRKVA